MNGRAIPSAVPTDALSMNLTLLVAWLASAGSFAAAGRGLTLEGVAVRGLLAGALAAAIVLLFGRRAIECLRHVCPEPIKTASPALEALHAHKASTPSMGGLLILCGWLVAVLWFADLGDPFVQAALLLAVGLTAIGVADDLVKAHSRRRGLGGKVKLAAQTIVALAAVWLTGSADHSICLPALGTVALGAWFLPVAALVIVGSSNAVNLTDGLDGLAAGCAAASAAALAAAALATRAAAGSLASAGENEVVVSVALAGATLAFVWFNRQPARVFMGDSGALPLGGLLGLIAIGSGQMLLLPIVAAVFVMEAVSVILQVGWFRCTGRRLLRCAPLHHHFEFLGWPEARIVRAFWAVSAASSLLGVMLWRLGTP